MITWDESRTISQRLAQDSSTDGVAFLDMMMNVGYKELLEDFGRQQTEIEATADLVAGQRGYQMPPDCAWPKTVTIIDGTTITPVYEEPSDKNWAYLSSGSQRGKPDQFHYKPRFGVGGGVLELNPIPSSSSYDMKLVYEATDKTMSKTAYSAGSVSLTNGNATLTGSGTTFTSDMVGRYFQVTSEGQDRLWYRIVGYTGATTLTLENYYQGATGSALTYQIAEAFNVPESMQIIPVYYAVWHWWDSKKDPINSKKFKGYYDEAMKRAKKRYSIVARDNIINPGLPLSPFDSRIYPAHFPLEVT